MRRLVWRSNKLFCFVAICIILLSFTGSSILKNHVSADESVSPWLAAEAPTLTNIESDFL